MKFPEAMSAGQLAQLTGAELIGDATVLVLGLNEIHNVQAGDITFVDHPKYYNYTLRSAAAVVLIKKPVEDAQGKTLLLCEDPFAAYNLLAQKFHPPLFSTSRIALSASIGEGCVIAPTSFIGEKVTLGRNCIIHANATIAAYSQIGDNCIIHPNTTIGVDAFYYKSRGTYFDKMHTAGRTLLENDVEIGANCTIAAGVSSDTVIGKGTKIDSHVHIGHDVKIGAHCIFASQVGIAGNVNIGDFVILYGKVGVSKNLTIPNRVTVLASSNVGGDLEEGKTYFGSPCEEARKAWRQLAMMRKLPELWDKLTRL